MASASLTTKTHADADVVLTLVGQGKGYANYKLVTQPLNRPIDLTLNYKVGEAGSKSNDHLIATMRCTYANTDGTVSVGIASMDVSVPRGDGWASGNTENMVNMLTHLFGGTARVANRETFADGIAF